jgi:hypothetical protein
MPSLGWRERLNAIAAELRLDGGLVALFLQFGGCRVP